MDLIKNIIFPIILLTSIFLLCSIRCVKSIKIEGFYHEIEDLRDRSFDSGQLQSTSENSLVTCGVLCTKSKLCGVTGWNSFTKMCKLYNREPILDGNEKLEQGWLYLRNLSSLCTRCPASFGYSCEDDVGICYKYNNDKKTVHMARQLCLDEGGRFMRIDSQEKQIYAAGILSGGAYSDSWIQGQNLDTVYRYDDGTPFTYSNWNSGEGQNPPFGKSMYPILRKSQGYKWHDSNGAETTTAASLCEII